MRHLTLLLLAACACAPTTDDGSDLGPDNPDVAHRLIDDGFTAGPGADDASLTLDIDDNGVGDLEFYLSRDIEPAFEDIEMDVYAADGGGELITGADGVPVPLAVGDRISAGSATWESSAELAERYIADGQTEELGLAGAGRTTLGVRFQRDGSYHYAWLALTFEEDYRTLTLHELGWNTVPEADLRAGDR